MDDDDQSFAIITPSNAFSRLAFSDVYDALISGGQSSQSDDAQAALRRMVVEPKQIFDGEVFRLRLEAERRLLRKAGGNDNETGESHTDSETDTEQSRQELGMTWVGRYLLGLQFHPLVVGRGWLVGKGELGNGPVDLLLCTRSTAEEHEINIRNPHAIFNFDTNTRGFFIIGCSRSPSAQLTVNGQAVARKPHHLNQHSMKIQFDKLAYDFQWTEYASTKPFIVERNNYVITYLDGPPNVMIDMPTPLPNRRTIGKWTLGEPLGKGAQGSVFFGSDASGNVAAIKTMERTSRSCHSADEEIEILREVNHVADKSDNSERILRMVDVIYSNKETFATNLAFDHVTIVLQPLVPQTFAELMGPRSSGETKGMTMEAASAFRDALVGVKVMHDEGWLHRDLKPTNIGLIGTPLRSVLLDLGTSRHIPAGGSIQPQPFTVGTVNYLAPELELEDYDHSIDIWSMAIILYQLTYGGRHPWKMACNPWCTEMRNKRLRPHFQTCYERVVNQMSWDSKIAHLSPTEGYIHLGALFVEMVRHKWARSNNERRPDIDEVLEHPAWGSLLSDEHSQVKRRRL